jgi:hypothetical protein
VRESAAAIAQAAKWQREALEKAGDVFNYTAAGVASSQCRAGAHEIAGLRKTNDRGSYRKSRGPDYRSTRIPPWTSIRAGVGSSHNWSTIDLAKTPAGGPRNPQTARVCAACDPQAAWWKPPSPNTPPSQSVRNQPRRKPNG